MSDQTVVPKAHESITAGEAPTERLDTHTDRDPAIVEFRKRRRSRLISPVLAGITGIGLLLVTLMVLARATDRQRVVTTAKTTRAYSPEIHTHERGTPAVAHHTIVCCRAMPRKRSSGRHRHSDTHLPRRTRSTSANAPGEQVRRSSLRTPPTISAHSPSVAASASAGPSGFRYLGR
jgi:hypothetical protein